MNALTRFARSPRFVLLFFAALLLPLSVGAQPVLSVSPTSVSVQANTGTNAPSQTVRVSNAGNRALKMVGCGGQCELGPRIAQQRREQRYTHVDLRHVRTAGGTVSDLVPHSEHDGIGYHGQCAGEHRRLRRAPAARSADRHLPGEYIRRLFGRIVSCRDLRRQHVGRGRSRDCNRLAGVGEQLSGRHDTRAGHGAVE